MNWTPIETAPRDGSHILVADFTPGAVGFGKYSGKTQPWQCVVHWWDVPGQEGFYPSSGSSDLPVKATHWMPLPSAADQPEPQDAGQEGEK